MKSLKNLIKTMVGFFLACMMAVIPAASVFGASGIGSDQNGSITVENVVPGQVYSIYKIFDLESFSDDNPNEMSDGAYSYRISSDSPWYGFVTGAGIGADYVTVDTNGYVTWKEDRQTESDYVQFAKSALDYVNLQSIFPVDQSTAEESSDEIVFSNLALGYYLVDSTCGALCDLTTTNPDARVIEKNSSPTLEKSVWEEGVWGEKNDADIGDSVEYRVLITVEGYAKGYLIHDVMGEGLTYDGVSRISLNNELVMNENQEDYVVDSSPDDGCTFHVRFTDAFCENLNNGDAILVSYTGILNQKASSGEAQKNIAYLEYEDYSGKKQETTPSETSTWTWKIPVLKYANGDPSRVLSGAEFSLYTDQACTKVISFSEAKNAADQIIPNQYQVDSGGTIQKVVTDTTGRLEFHGLDAGTYYLKEVEAPTGYNRLDTVVRIIIDHDGRMNPEDKDGNDVIEAGEYEDEIGVNNNSGTLLPSTGGMGTKIFYVVGSLCVTLAVVLLVGKKRKEKRYE